MATVSMIVICSHQPGLESRQYQLQQEELELDLSVPLTDVPG